MKDYIIIAALGTIMGMALVLPFSVKKVEEELEAFLFVMGFMAAAVSGVLDRHLLAEAAREPLAITGAVVLVGFAFRAVRPRLSSWLNALSGRTSPAVCVFLLVALLGLGSSVLTAIVSALILAEAVSVFRFDRASEVRIVTYACYAIGLGAVLTPLGEPLSTITVARLKGPPHHAGFFFLAGLMWLWVIPGVLLSAYMAARCAAGAAEGDRGLRQDQAETPRGILARGARVYIFVAALVLLGRGLAPVAARFITVLPSWALYWLNTVSAILDNATLAAAEITPFMTREQITFTLMGLLVAGGMLIPGNIPNIISASKLSIRSGEWARAAIPFGAALMLAYFLVMSAALI